MATPYVRVLHLKIESKEHRKTFDGLNRSNVGVLINLAKSVGWSRAKLPRGQQEAGLGWTLVQARAQMNHALVYVASEDIYLYDLRPRSLRSLNASLAKHMPVVDGRKTKASSLHESGYGTTVEYRGYRPGGDAFFIGGRGDRFVNTYIAHELFPIQPSNEDAQTFVDLINHVSNGNDETREGLHRLLTKLLYLFVTPSARILHMTLLVGKMTGTGKSLLTKCIPKALFGHNVRVVETKELCSDFNAYAADIRILVFSELALGNKKEADDLANGIKSLLTDDESTVTRKGVDGKELENHITVFASSNFANAASINDFDRRYDVISTDAPAISDALGKRSYELITQRPGALLWLMNKAYGPRAELFDPNARPPETAAKRRMVNTRRAVWAEQLRDSYAAKEWPFNCDAVSVPEVRRHLESNFNPPPSDNAINSEIIDMAPEAEHMQAKRRTGKLTPNKRLLVTRNVGKWKEAGPSALYDHYIESLNNKP